MTQDPETLDLRDEAAFRVRAAEIYRLYAGQFKRRFKWLRPDLFVAQLKKDLTTDSARLLKILDDCGDWDHAKDTKLAALIELADQEASQKKKC